MDKYTVKIKDKKMPQTAKLTEKTVERTIEVPVIENYVDVKLPHKSKFKNGGFVTVFQKAILNIAMFAKLSKNELQLLLYLIGSCAFDNSIIIDYNKLTGDLHMAKPNISAALKGLVKRNIVLRKNGYRWGKNPLPFELELNYDQLNYNLSYNGEIKTYKQKQQKHPPLTKEDGVTILEDHTQGQPIRMLQSDGRILTQGSLFPPEKE